MDQERMKRRVAEAAADHVVAGSVLGVGTGSTVNHFIDVLKDRGVSLAGTVSSSEATTARLRDGGYEVMDLNHTGDLDLYVDGADEVDGGRCLIKGGGGALTREKIVAAASRRFVCIVDSSKVVRVLGAFPLPIEVIPMARSYVARQMVAMGGQPELRDGFTTDNGNVILDVHNLDITDPRGLETRINQLAGVVCVGLFAHRGADVVLVGRDGGVEEMGAEG